MIAAAAVVLALASGNGGDHSRYSQTLTAIAPLASGGEVEIDDEFGNIVVSPGAAGSVKITAVKHASKESDLADMDMHIDAVDGAVKISTTFPGVSLFAHQQDSIDYDVRVPSGTKLIIRGKYGDVEVSGVGGAIDADSQYGDVEVDGAVGPATLNSEYGNVTLSVTALQTGDRITMRTTFGDVDLTLPKGTKPHVRAKTFFGDVEDHVDSSQGGPPVDLRTTFGDVDVR